MSKGKFIKNKKFDYMDVLLFVVPFLTGLFSIWSAALLAILCMGGILYKVLKNKRIYLPTGKNLVCLLIYIVSFLVVEFYAIDKGMNVLGFFKNASLLLFLLLYVQYDNENTEKASYSYRFRIIPYSACCTVVVSLILALIPSSAIFYNHRFQGTFDYANSYGLFLLLGIFVLANKETYTWKDYFVFGILFIGIVLTNSRAIILLTLLAIIISFFMNKTNGKKLIIVAISFVLLFGGTYLFSKMEKRLSADMFESSEFVTRLLYYNDAIEMIKENPFGYGYNGWYYKQVEVQTGVYDTKFVHNSLLQVLLDVGVLPTIALCFMLIITFFGKKQTMFSRMIMILILGHSLIDIDLEYMYFLLLLIMLIDFKPIKVEKMSTRSQWLWTSLLSIVGIWYFVIFLSDANYSSKNYKEAVKIIPFHTEAIQEVLYSVTTKEEQLEYAHKALKYNQIVSGAYEAISNDLQERGEYKEALALEEKRLSYNKYTMYNYMVYADFLAKGISYYSSHNQESEERLFLEKVVEIEEKMQKVIANTNPLCYKTIHVPELEITDQLQELIDHAKRELD